MPSVYAAALPIDTCVSAALVEPRPQLREDGWRLGATQLGDANDVTLAALIDLVERGDPRERTLGIGMIGHRLVELAEHVRPAPASTMPGPSRAPTS